MLMDVKNQLLNVFALEVIERVKSILVILYLRNIPGIASALRSLLFEPILKLIFVDRKY